MATNKKKNKTNVVSVFWPLPKEILMVIAYITVNAMHETETVL